MYNSLKLRKGALRMQPVYLQDGVEFYSFQDSRFKQGALSIQFVRPMKKEEAAKNARPGLRAAQDDELP